MASGSGTKAIRNGVGEKSVAILFLVVVGLLSQTTGVSAQTGDWPDHDAYWIIEIKKDPNTIAPSINHGYELLDPANSSVQVRYLVHGVVVSDWIDPLFRFDLSIDNPALAALSDGIHDLSLEGKRRNANAVSANAGIHTSVARLKQW